MRPPRILKTEYVKYAQSAQKPDVICAACAAFAACCAYSGRGLNPDRSIKLVCHNSNNNINNIISISANVGAAAADDDIKPPPAPATLPTIESLNLKNLPNVLPCE